MRQIFNNKKLCSELQRAIERYDAKRVGRIVDVFRFAYGANYAECFQVAHKLTAISFDDWDALLYEADEVV